jgi:ribA/ribD-fused uncharacterized protein
MSGLTNNTRYYDAQMATVFHKTREEFGGLSNMATGFPISINGVLIHSSEALYQALRFTHRPEVQSRIISVYSPMTAKMLSKPYRNDSRADWDAVKVSIMRWCLRAKLFCNFNKFSRLLIETGEKPIVEFSRKDDYWGAKPESEGVLMGSNILGRLLMELRAEILAGTFVNIEYLAPLKIPDFYLLSKQIGPIKIAMNGINQVRREVGIFDEH